MTPALSSDPECTQSSSATTAYQAGYKRREHSTPLLQHQHEFRHHRDRWPLRHRSSHSDQRGPSRCCRNSRNLSGRGARPRQASPSVRSVRPWPDGNLISNWPDASMGVTAKQMNYAGSFGSGGGPESGSTTPLPGALMSSGGPDDSGSSSKGRSRPVIGEPSFLPPPGGRESSSGSSRSDSVASFRGSFVVMTIRYPHFTPPKRQRQLQTPGLLGNLNHRQVAPLRVQRVALMGHLFLFGQQGGPGGQPFTL